MYYCLGFVADVAQTFGREHRVLRTPNCSLVVGNCLSRIRSGFQERMRSWRILASLPIRRISRRSTWKRFEFGKASPSSASSWKIPKSSGLYDALRGPYSPLLLCICIINEEWPGSITTKVRPGIARMCQGSCHCGWLPLPFDQCRCLMPFASS